MRPKVMVSDETANTRYSLAAPSPRLHCLSGCSLFARSTLYCKFLLSASLKPTALYLTPTGLSRFLLPSRPVRYHTSAQDTGLGSSRMPG